MLCLKVFLNIVLVLHASMKRLRISQCATTTACMVFAIILLEIAIKQIFRRRVVKKSNAIFLNHFIDGAIEDLLDLTESDESSSSSNAGVFENHQPFVLELHDLVKDEPEPENQQTGSKVKKHKKKKKGQSASKTHTSDSSSTVSENSVPPTGLDDHSKDEYYDAHESYHGIIENQAASPVAAAGILQAVSEHRPDPKVVQQQETRATRAQQDSARSRREPSTISKPSTGP